MKTYHINRVCYGMPEKTILTVKAYSIESAWLGSKFWFSPGVYYVFPNGDYGNGTQYTKQ